MELREVPQGSWRVERQDGGAKLVFVGVGIQVLNVGVDAGEPSLPSLGYKKLGFQAGTGQGERVGHDESSVDLNDYVH